MTWGLLGIILQCIGIILSICQISSLRKEFGKEGFFKSAWQWVNPPKATTTMSVSLPSMTANAVVRVTPKDESLEDSVTRLTSEIDRINNKVQSLEAEIETSKKMITNTKKSVIEEAEVKIKNALVGGSLNGIAALLLILLGTVLTAF